ARPPSECVARARLVAAPDLAFERIQRVNAIATSPRPVVEQDGGHLGDRRPRSAGYSLAGRSSTSTSTFRPPFQAKVFRTGLNPALRTSTVPSEDGSMSDLTSGVTPIDWLPR